MDESSLRALIACLEKQIDSLHGLLHLWTILVIFGCAGELCFVIHEYLDDRTVWYKARTRGFIAIPERPHLFLLILELASVAAVVIGISGELNVDFKSSRLETQLRDENTKLIFLLEGRANDAEVAAKNAKSDASVAKQLADTAGSAADRAQNKVREVAAKADDMTRELNTADGKLRQLQLFALASHFRDTDALVSAMKQFKGRQVTLRSYIGDAEGWMLCVSLLDAAKKAEMNPTDQCGQSPFDVGRRPEVGITVSGLDFLAVVDAIEKGRPNAGVSGQDKVDTQDPSVIFIGIKNPVWLPEHALATTPQQKSKNTPRTPKP
jgi:hypothetical protein